MTDPARQATTNARIPLWSMPVAGAMTPGFPIWSRNSPWVCAARRLASALTVAFKLTAPAERER